MGLLSLGTPLPWAEAKQYAEHVRTHGIEQLIHIIERNKHKSNDKLLWGDEVEYMVVVLDPASREATVSLSQATILENLARAEQRGEFDSVTFHPEYGRYMLESTPAAPYSGDFADLCTVQANMAKRRVIARAHMDPDTFPLTLTSYPRLGTADFTSPHCPPVGSASRSLFLPDEIINPHARFPTLTANIRERRGCKVAINVPLFMDKHTHWPNGVDPSILRDRALFPEDANARDGAALPNHIYMDSMGFGMGCCCLQITFQATDMDEARLLYDQLAPLTPIFLALSAAAPAYRGYLADQDARWSVIAASVDDRTADERNPASPHYIPKSRYDSIDSYLSTSRYNDTNLVINHKVKQRLLEAGVDELLANHFAHLFIRDPLVVFRELLDQNDEQDSDHFENIQSTNWQNMRFKPPPANSQIGWRVEFRPMEVQVTDFENAAFSVFIVLVTRVILSYHLNLLVPISKLDDNMKRAQRRDAVLHERFWFRTNVNDAGDGRYAQLSVNDIVNGTADFLGLVPLVRQYVREMNVDVEVQCQLERYIEFVSRRASGKLKTTAAWIRHFFTTHPDYKQDSVVTDKMNYDLMAAILKITNEKEFDLKKGLDTYYDQ